MFRKTSLLFSLLFALSLPVQADVVPWGKPGDSKLVIQNAENFPRYTFYWSWYYSGTKEPLRNDYSYHVKGGGGNPMRAYIWAVDRKDTTLHTDSLVVWARDDDHNWRIDKVEGGKIYYTESVIQDSGGKLASVAFYIFIVLIAASVFLALWLIRRKKSKKSVA